MGYQTSRLAAEYAACYAVTGDPVYKDRAYRGFNYSTYMMKDNGEASDGPTDNVGYWWSDVYGEGPRMFFYGFMAVPEWAPPSENHILYSVSVLRNVIYASGRVQYTPTDDTGIEYLRLAFLPSDITVDGVSLPLRSDLNAEGYTVRDLGNGDYAVTMRRMRTGDVVFSGTGQMPVPFDARAFSYSAVPSPVVHADAALSKPLSVGDIGRGTLDLRLTLLPFSGPVDVYLFMYAPSLDPNIWGIVSAE